MCLPESLKSQNYCHKFCMCLFICDFPLFLSNWIWISIVCDFSDWFYIDILIPLYSYMGSNLYKGNIQFSVLSLYIKVVVAQSVTTWGLMIEGLHSFHEHDIPSKVRKYICTESFTCINPRVRLFLVTFCWYMPIDLETQLQEAAAVVVAVAAACAGVKCK